MHVKARADITDERKGIIVEDIVPLDQLRQGKIRTAWLQLNSNSANEATLKNLRAAFEKFPGSCPVKAQYVVDGVTVHLSIPVQVEPVDELIEKVESICGGDSLVFVV